MSDDREAFQRRTNVSRETLERLDAYARLLGQWTKAINLVSASTLDTIWTRHYLDSAQLLGLKCEGKNWVDLGSGGGFPGAVVGVLARELRPEINVTLIEADQRKATFLRTISRELDVPLRVLDQRIEDARPQTADVLSARALAPLDKLLRFSERHLASGGVALFLKGEKADLEIAAALEHWRFRCETHPSETDENSVVLKIGDVERA